MKIFSLAVGRRSIFRLPHSLSLSPRFCSFSVHPTRNTVLGLIRFVYPAKKKPKKKPASVLPKNFVLKLTASSFHRVNPSDDLRRCVTAPVAHAQLRAGSSALFRRRSPQQPAKLKLTFNWRTPDLSLGHRSRFAKKKNQKKTIRTKQYKNSSRLYFKQKQQKQKQNKKADEANLFVFFLGFFFFFVLFCGFCRSCFFLVFIFIFLFFK